MKQATKKITMFNYLFSIFNKSEFLEMDNKVYSRFMINRFLISVNDPNITSIISEINGIQYQNLSNEDHYFILYNAIPKGFYKIPKNLVFTENTKWNKTKTWLSKFGNEDNLSIKDISYILSLMNDEDRDKLYERIELLEQEAK